MKNRTIFLLLLGALSVVLIGAGFQGTPIPLADSLNRIRPGIGRHASVSILDANTTTSYFLSTVGGSPAVYPDRGTLVIVARTAATCCLAQATTGLTIGDQTTASAVVVTDANGPDGNGDCRTLAAGGEWHTTIDVRSHRSIIGARTGVCSNYIAAASAVPGYRIKPACRVDGDCTGAGAPAGTTCNLSPTEADFDESGLAAFCKATAAATFASAHFEH